MSFPLLKLDEAAAILGRDADHVLNLARARRIPFIAFDGNARRGSIRFDRDDLEKVKPEQLELRERDLDLLVKETPTTRLIFKKIGNRRHVHKDSRVYFVRCGDFIKVGVTKNAAARISSFRTGSPHEIELIGTIWGDNSTEKAIHGVLEDQWYRGEWFHYSAYLLRSLRCLCAIDVRGYLADEGTNVREMAD